MAKDWAWIYGALGLDCKCLALGARAGMAGQGMAAEVVMAQLVSEADPLRDESYDHKQTGGSGEDLAAPLGHLAWTTL